MVKLIMDKEVPTTAANAILDQNELTKPSCNEGELQNKVRVVLGEDLGCFKNAEDDLWNICRPKVLSRHACKHKCLTQVVCWRVLRWVFKQRDMIYLAHLRSGTARHNSLDSVNKRWIL